mmetsp:Transcript_34969/g.78778  ORF Transcript_34969/g.78778 Transcript_34969/m.78778 type:complete len:257 (+) Transcript_34969:920-1690(+)
MPAASRLPVQESPGARSTGIPGRVSKINSAGNGKPRNCERLRGPLGPASNRQPLLSTLPQGRGTSSMSAISSVRTSARCACNARDAKDAVNSLLASTSRLVGWWRHAPGGCTSPVLCQCFNAARGTATAAVPPSRRKRSRSEDSFPPPHCFLASSKAITIELSPAAPQESATTSTCGLPTTLPREMLPLGTGSAPRPFNSSAARAPRSKPPASHGLRGPRKAHCFLCKPVDAFLGPFPPFSIQTGANGERIQGPPS